MSEQRYQEAFGAIVSTPDIRDYRLNEVFIDLPLEYELSMPNVKNQMYISSCVAQSLALVMEYYIQQQHGAIGNLSSGYIYGNRDMQKHQEKGMIMREAIAQACKDGAPSFYSFPHHEEVPEIISLAKKRKPHVSAEAQQYRLSGYAAVSTPDEIKTAIMAGAPVIATFDWYKNTIDDNYVIHFDHSSPDPTGHCITIYGWDERGWKIQNSWGVFWGDGGKAIIPYSDFPTVAYALLDNHIDTLDIKKPFYGKTAFGKWVYKCFNKIAQTVMTALGSAKKWFKKKKEG